MSVVKMAACRAFSSHTALHLTVISRPGCCLPPHTMPRGTLRDTIIRVGRRGAGGLANPWTSPTDAGVSRKLREASCLNTESRIVKIVPRDQASPLWGSSAARPAHSHSVATCYRTSCHATAPRMAGKGVSTICETHRPPPAGPGRVE
jgi:hypothetical protein